MTLSLELGAVVWEPCPDGAQFTPRGGIVVKRGADPATGEQWVDVLRSRMARNRFEVYVTRLKVDALDSASCEPPTAAKRHRAARQILRALGEKQSAKVTGFDFELFLMALGLVYDDGEASIGRVAA